MSEIVGVRFQKAGKIYHFDTGEMSLEIGELVVVETNRGREIGSVITKLASLPAAENSEPLKPVIRKATDEDKSQSDQRDKRNEKALHKSKELIAKLNLPMKPIAAQYNLDGSHLTVFFSAENRVDFRELVKELSRSLRTYVELRQIGARDEAKQIGGIGKCGLCLCCTTCLSEFSPVSIKMAKEQNITLNPMKTSGLCGRLLCCLGYEYEQYKSMKENFPAINQIVDSHLGKAKVVGINPLKNSIIGELESGATVELMLDQIKLTK
jgi:cell fate regulator YaaT (PSP1 superfamily)